MQDHTGEGQGHHRGESTTQTLKRAFGWDSTPKMLKSPFFLGLIGSLLVGMMILNDKVRLQNQIFCFEFRSSTQALFCNIRLHTSSHLTTAILLYRLD